mgnify:CR=1 FL=1
MAGGMNFVRFMKGALKGEIAHQEAIAKAEADRIKAEQEATKEQQAFVRDLVKQIPFERVGPEAAKLLGDVKTVADVVNVYSYLDDEKNNEGFKYIAKEIFDFGAKNPKIFQNVDFSSLNAITDVDSAKEYLAMNPSMFDNLGKPEERTQEEKDILSMNQSALLEITKQQVQGRKFSGKPIKFGELDMYSFNAYEAIQAFAATAMPNEKDNKDGKLKIGVTNFGPNFSVEFPKIDSPEIATSTISDLLAKTQSLHNSGDINVLTDINLQNQIKRKITEIYDSGLGKYTTTLTMDGKQTQRTKPYSLTPIINSYNLKDNPALNVFFDHINTLNNGIPPIVAGSGAIEKTDIDDNGTINTSYVKPQSTEGEFALLATSLGVPVQDIAKGDRSTFVMPDGNMKIFRAAQNMLVKMPNMITVNDDGSISNKFTNYESFVESPARNRQFFKNLTGSGLTPEEQVDVLRLLVNTPSQGVTFMSGGYGINIDAVNYLLSYTKQKDIGAAVDYVKTKKVEAEEIFKLIDDQVELLRTGKVKAGFSQNLRNFLSGLKAQAKLSADVIIDAINPLTATQNVYEDVMFEEIDFDDGEFSKVLERAKNYVQTGFTESEAAGRKNTAEIFLAYRMAKYFDDAGRISDQDFKKALESISGGGLVETARAIAQLDYVREQVESRNAGLIPLDFKVSSIYTATAPGMPLSAKNTEQAKNLSRQVSNKIEAVRLYNNLSNDRITKFAARLQFYPVNDRVRKGYDAINNTNMTYKGKPVFKVYNAEEDGSPNLNEPRFESFGGLYVIRQTNEENSPFEKVDNSEINLFQAGAAGSVSSIQKQEQGGIEGITPNPNSTQYPYIDNNNGNLLTQEDYDKLMQQSKGTGT